jgi:hypothetical protein
MTLSSLVPESEFTLTHGGLVNPKEGEDDKDEDVQLIFKGAVVAGDLGDAHTLAGLVGVATLSFLLGLFICPSVVPMRTEQSDSESLLLSMH